MSIFKRRKRFTVLLKSGNSFVVVAGKCIVERNTQTGALASYEFKNINTRQHGYPLFLDPNQIEAITY